MSGADLGLTRLLGLAARDAAALGSYDDVILPVLLLAVVLGLGTRLALPAAPPAAVSLVLSVCRVAFSRLFSSLLSLYVVVRSPSPAPCQEIGLSA